MQTADAQRQALLPRIIFAYLAIFQIVTVVIAYFLSPEAEPAFFLERPTTWLFYLFGIFAFGLAFFLPRVLARKTPPPPLFVPFVIRLCLFETATVMGFALAITAGNWYAMLPLLALGLIGTMLSPPTQRFFETMKS